MNQMIFTSERIKRNRKRVQLTYKIFLIIFILISGFILKTNIYLKLIMGVVAFFLLRFELRSPWLGRRNIFGGYLKIEDEICENYEISKKIICNKEYKINSNPSNPIALTLLFLIPLSGFIKELIFFKSHDISIYHFTPFLIVTGMLFIGIKYTKKNIHIDNDKVVIQGTFKKNTIKFNEDIKLKMIDLSSYYRRYTTYIEIIMKRRVIRIPIEEIESFNSLKNDLESRCGYKINYT